MNYYLNLILPSCLELLGLPSSDIVTCRNWQRQGARGLQSIQIFAKFDIWQIEANNENLGNSKILQNITSRFNF